MTQLTFLGWRALSRPPRRLWVPCVECHYSSINEDKALRGWQETTNLPRRYRCAECVERERANGGTPGNKSTGPVDTGNPATALVISAASDESVQGS